nr:nudix hydrolase 9 [Ipomoea trifida]
MGIGYWENMDRWYAADGATTFVGTNLSPLSERFLVQSEDDCKQCQHTSSPLGNGAIVETSDKKILVLRRSNRVGEFPGYLVFPGGHPEPLPCG